MGETVQIDPKVYLEFARKTGQGIEGLAKGLCMTGAKLKDCLRKGEMPKQIDEDFRSWRAGV